MKTLPIADYATSIGQSIVINKTDYNPLQSDIEYPKMFKKYERHCFVMLSSINVCSMWKQNKHNVEVEVLLYVHLADMADNPSKYLLVFFFAQKWIESKMRE